MKIGDRTYGQNMTKLILRHLSVQAVPAGGGIGSAMNFISKIGTPEWKEAVLRAEEFANTAVRLMRSAAPPNPYVDADDETIAGVIERASKDREERERSEGA